jgi:exonuclease SbcC
MLPLTLELTGFKGVRSAYGVDKKTWDFRDIPDGRIALVGPNGSAKSTVLQNLHPFLLMPDKVKSYSPKSFSYYNECYGSGACKDLTWIHYDGRVFRSLVEIDADRRKTKAYLYMQNGETWDVFANAKDGNVEVYNQAIEDLLGTPRMFFTYVFRSQRARRLSGYTKGEMETLLTELLDIRDLKEKAGEAGYIEDALIAKRDAIVAESSALTAVASKENEKKAEKEAAEKKTAELFADMQKLEEQIKTEESSLKDIEVKISLQEEALKGRQKIESEIAAKENVLNELKSSLQAKKDLYNSKYKTAKINEQNARALVNKSPELKKIVVARQKIATEIDETKKLIEKEDAELTSLNERMSAISSVESLIKEKEKVIQKIRLDRKSRIDVLMAEIKNAESKVSLLSEVPCGNSPEAALCKFPQDALKAKKILPSMYEGLKNAEAPDPKESEMSAEIESLKKEIALKGEVDAKIKALRESKGVVSKKLSALEDNARKSDEALKELPLIEDAEKKIEAITKEVADVLSEGKTVVKEIEVQIARAESEIKGLKDQLAAVQEDKTLAVQKQAIEGRINSIKKSVDNKRREESATQASLGAITEALKQIEDAKSNLLRVTSQVEVLNAEIREWKIVSDRIEGIIPLEIDDAGPSIGAIANDLLLSCYGPRFTVKISTQEFTADGKNMKDDYDIIVYDAERGESKSLSDCSGGEEIWLEDAITKATCLFKTSRSGKQYLALFSDEKDGSLHEGKKLEYMDMKRRVLEVGRFKKEFFISHSEAVQARADYVVKMG